MSTTTTPAPGTLGAIIPAIIRTAVPVLWGSLITWLIGLFPWVQDGLTWLYANTTVTEAAVIAGATLLATAGWYSLVRFLAVRLPWVELLLGWKVSPVYVPAEVAAEPQPVARITTLD